MAKPGTPGELVKDLTVTLAVELDRIPLSLEELLRLSPGQVLQLEKTPGRSRRPVRGRPDTSGGASW